MHKIPIAEFYHSVTLDEAIEAMRLTAADMSVKYKETSLSVSTSLRIYLHSANRFNRVWL